MTLKLFGEQVIFTGFQKYSRNARWLLEAAIPIHIHIQRKSSCKSKSEEREDTSKLLRQHFHFASFSRIPGNVSSYPDPNSVDKGKEEGEEQQKNDKTPPSSSDMSSSLTSQVSKTIPGTLRVTVGVPGHPNPLFNQKGKDAVKPNQTNEKTRSSSSDSSVTSQVSNIITGMPDVTCDGPSHTNPLSMNKRKGAFELNQKNGELPPGCLNCS